MSQKVHDIHPHIISKDDGRYPRAPLGGEQSDWSRERPVTAEYMVAAMDEAGVASSALVQAATCYGYDNSYVADAIERYPDRFTGVGTIDVLAPDAVERAEGLDRSWYLRASPLYGRQQARIRLQLARRPAFLPGVGICRRRGRSDLHSDAAGRLSRIVSNSQSASRTPGSSSTISPERTSRTARPTRLRNRCSRCRPIRTSTSR